MRTLFNALKERINDRVPEFKTVDLWSSQIESSLVERTEEGFSYPAVFIDLITEQVNNRALGVKDKVIRIEFHFAFESYRRDKGEIHLDLLDRFDQNMHRFAGTDFSTLQESNVDLDQNRTNVDTPIKSYRTVFRDPGSFVESFEFTGTLTTEINGEITSYDQI